MTGCILLIKRNWLLRSVQSHACLTNTETFEDTNAAWQDAPGAWTSVKCCISGPHMCLQSILVGCCFTIFPEGFPMLPPRFRHIFPIFTLHSLLHNLLQPPQFDHLASGSLGIHLTWRSPSRWSFNSGVLQLSLPKPRLTRPYEAFLHQQKHFFYTYLESPPQPFFDGHFLKHRMNWCSKPSRSLGNHYN